MVDSGRDVRRIKLTGARFEGGRLPVDSLIELERYQQLLRTVARAEWIEDHPDEPIPDGFDNGISLTIESIEAGSADVLLAFENQAIYASYQEEARDAVNAAIASAYSEASDPTIPDTLPPEIRVDLAAFGSTLAPGQSIEVYVAGVDDDPAVITVESRKRLVDQLAFEDWTSIPVEAGTGELAKHPASLVGRITEVDAGKSTFRFESLQHGDLTAHYKTNPELLTDIRAVLDSPDEAPVLRVDGELQFRSGAPWRFTSIDQLETFAVGNEPWAPRLLSFAELPAGWGDAGVGRAIEFIALDAAKRVLTGLTAEGLPMPAIFPTEEGGVILEWASPAEVRSVETLPSGDFELFLMRAGEQGALEATGDAAVALEFARGVA